jgi:hypothetical protein
MVRAAFQATQPEPEPEETAAEEPPEEAPPAKAQKRGAGATQRGKSTKAPAARPKPAATMSVPASKPVVKSAKAPGMAPRKSRCVELTCSVHWPCHCCGAD